MKLSHNFTRTNKDTISNETSKNAQYLMRAGYIHKSMPGVYSYLPLGLRVLNKIENIVRKHMNRVGGQEILMNSLHPQEWWQTTTRWDNVDILFKIKSQTGTEYALACSHEEQAVPIASSYFKSYKDLPDYNVRTGQFPLSIYQIQTKFRDEVRAKSGLLRGREFRMKDMYDFHTNSESQDAYYETVKQAYLDVYKELQLETYAVKASGGIFTTNLSHEFQSPCEAGEDWMYRDPISKDIFNSEIAPVQAPDYDCSNEEEKERQDIEMHGVIGVEALYKELNIDAQRTTKTIFYSDFENNLIAAVVRGDRTVNEEKLPRIAGKHLYLATEELVLAKTGAGIGYAGVVNVPEDTKIYYDNSVKNLKNFETGTNKQGYHSINVCFGRDVEYPAQFYDISEVQEGDTNPETGAKYERIRSAEVGNIFKLDDKYTKAFGVTYTDRNNQQQIPLMNCYGLGTSRVMAVIAENNADEKGLKWPESIAPYSYHLVSIYDKKDEALNDKIRQISTEFYNSHPDDVLWDDRLDMSFGQKMSDAELLGCPHIVIVSKRAIEQGEFELKNRITGESSSSKM